MSLKNTIGDLLKLGEIKDNIISLFEAKFELKKIEIQEKAEHAVSELIFTFILVLLGVLALVFALILAANGLNNWLGEPYGHLIVLATILFILLLVYSQKDAVKRKIRETIQKEMDAMDER